MTTTITAEDLTIEFDQQLGARPFPLWRRAVTLLLEGVVYLVLTLLVAIVEYFLGGPLTDFGLSNWWIGAVLYAALEGYSWPGGQSFAMRITGSSVMTAGGAYASTIQMAIRQTFRFLVVYGIAIWGLALVDRSFNVGWIVVVAGAVGVLALVMERLGFGSKAPWDLVVGTTVVEGAMGGAEVDLGPVRSTADLQLDPSRATQNRRAQSLMFAAGLSSVVVSALIVYNIFTEAAVFVADSEFSWGLLFDEGWFPRRGQFDLSTLFVGTLWVTLIAMVVAAPIGIGVEFYLSEYATERTQRLAKPLIETLASIPSVVLGLFAISFIFPNILRPIFSDIGIFSLLAAGLGVGILTIPIVASISEDAMRAVPQELREASYGLGARRATTALRVVFPAAISGISAALIVGISRAIGETMVVFIAAGGTGGQLFETDPTEAGQTVTAAMASVAAGTDSVAGSGLAFQSLYFLGALLFLFTLLLNVASDSIVRRFRQVY
ncbi:MAG: phosphate ABC transporter permease subunit PstC [Actinomycetota bacterium]